MAKGTAKVICDITTSADGYSAGLNQTEERPFGADGGDGWGDKLHAWFVETPDENRAEVDQMSAAKAFIMATCRPRCDTCVRGAQGGPLHCHPAPERWCMWLE